MKNIITYIAIIIPITLNACNKINNINDTNNENDTIYQINDKCIENNIKEYTYYYQHKNEYINNNIKDRITLSEESITQWMQNEIQLPIWFIQVAINDIKQNAQSFRFYTNVNQYMKYYYIEIVNDGRRIWMYEINRNCNKIRNDQ